MLRVLSIRSASLIVLAAGDAWALFGAGLGLALSFVWIKTHAMGRGLDTDYRPVILRAADNRMVSFLDMPTINGSGAIGVTPSVSTLFTGGSAPLNAGYNVIQGGFSSVTPSASLTLNNSFNFTQSSLDNAVFWKSYLNELPKETIKY